MSDKIGVNAVGAVVLVNDARNALTNVSGQLSYGFATVIVLSAWNKVRIFPDTLAGSVRQVVSAVNSHGLNRKAQRNCLKVRKTGRNIGRDMLIAQVGQIFCEIFAGFKNFREIRDEVTPYQSDSK